jgi:hypothetical protein
MARTHETKSFTADVRIKNEAAGEVEAVVATVDTVDRDGDVFLAGSAAPGKSVKVSAFGHDVVLQNAPPVGLGRIKEEAGKLILRARYFLSTARGRDAFETVRSLGPDSEWSLGFPQDSVRVDPLTAEWRAKGARRLISWFVPIEASPVLRGAQLGTATLATKAHRGRPDYERHRARFARLYGPTVAVKAASPEADAVARHFIAWTAARWGVHPPALKWFEPDGSDRAGWCPYDDSGTVWLRKGLTGQLLQWTAAHETIHFARHVRGMENVEATVVKDTDAIIQTYALEASPAWHRHKMASSAELSRYFGGPVGR